MYGTENQASPGLWPVAMEARFLLTIYGVLSPELYEERKEAERVADKALRGQ